MTSPGAQTYQLDVWRALGALLTGKPRLTDDARQVLAEMVYEALGESVAAVNAAFPGLPAPGGPDEMMTTFKELYRKGFITVGEDGVARVVMPWDLP